jgi:hypothetical protein
MVNAKAHSYAGGQTWLVMSQALYAIGATRLAMDLRDEDRIYNSPQVRDTNHPTCVARLTPEYQESLLSKKAASAAASSAMHRSPI